MLQSLATAYTNIRQLKPLNISVVILSVILTISIVLLVGAHARVGQMLHGANDGFPLTGTYSADNSLERSLYLRHDSENDSYIWGERQEDGNYLRGEVRVTEDPNIFFLYDDAGSAYALIHIAYADDSNGSLFISKNLRDFSRLNRISDIPTTLS